MLEQMGCRYGSWLTIDRVVMEIQVDAWMEMQEILVMKTPSLVMKYILIGTIVLSYLETHMYVIAHASSS